MSRCEAARRAARRRRPSGCGKTTLLELICGLQAPERVLHAAPAVLMPQRDLLLPWLDALDNAALALRIAGARARGARERAAAMFAELGLDGFEAPAPGELSGGMRQRVAFLRTLLSGKPVLCLDEPFGALDAITRGEMQEWLAGALAREPRTVVLVTHDVEEAVLLADRVVVLSPRPGRVVRRAARSTLPRPRRRIDADVVALRERALERSAEGAAMSASRGRRMRPSCAPAPRAALARRAWTAGAAAAAAAGAARRMGALRRDLRRRARAAAGAARVASALWHGGAVLWRNFAVTAEEVALASPRARGRLPARRWRCTSRPPLRRAVYPLRSARRRCRSR